MEDHPVCRVEMVDNCDKSQDRFDACKRVPAMRCRIEQRVVVQTRYARARIPLLNLPPFHV